MAESYKLTYNNKPLTFPGWNGHISFNVPVTPVRRYEYSLYPNPDGIGVSAGTLASATTAFDEIIIGVGWQDTRNLHGIEYNYFQSFNADGAVKNGFGLQHYFSNGNNYFLFETRMDVDNTNLTFQCSANTANYWGVSTPQTTTAAMANWNAIPGRLKCVTDIIGVKYQ